jgi:hypothetical protein
VAALLFLLSDNILNSRKHRIKPIFPSGHANPVLKDGVCALDQSSANKMISIGIAVPFNQTPVVSGTAISKVNETDFYLYEKGLYYCYFIGQSASLSLLGSLQFYLNGNPIGPICSIDKAGQPYLLQAVIDTRRTSLPAALQIIGSNAMITFSADSSLTFFIQKLSD